MTLRLADAILLGDSLKKRDSEIFLWRDGSCGCALGGAFLANGGAAEKSSYPLSVISMWPWLTGLQRVEIGTMYENDTPIEAIAAYADSIDPTPRCEPLVQEPSLVETESTVSHG